MEPRRTLRLFLIPLVALSGAGFVHAQTTERVSVATGGTQADAECKYFSISADGRYAAFVSSATNLVAADTNGCSDVFVRDRQSGTTERVSVSSTGVQGNDASGAVRGVSISADGRWVAFQSDATNLVAADTNGHTDIFVHDRVSGITERVSVISGGTQSTAGFSRHPSISASGRFVAFDSSAWDLVPGDTNGVADVFVHDRQTATTERVSIDSAGVEGDDLSTAPVISGAGDVVAFRSSATNLVAGDTNHTADIFVRDRLTASTERVSISSLGVQGNGFSNLPAISADGRCVGFQSLSTNLVVGVTIGHGEVFVRDRLSGTTECVSLTPGGLQGDLDSGFSGCAVSADGRWIAFQSASTDLVAGDTNSCGDTFLRDRQSGTTERVSLASSGLEGSQASGNSCVAISAGGRFVAFDSYANNLVSSDTNGVPDVFLRDRGGDFTSQCEPGSAGVITCPCANPPSSVGRGCDNSSFTGGAILTAFGAAHLSADTLVFTTAGEKPTAASVVLQGTSSLPSGVLFGQGVRCVSGSLKRLYVHSAIGGSISAPAGADLSVSARSAQLGDPISAGSSRYYAVYYRDPIVLGGCPSTSTFNMTQGGAVLWQP